MISRLRPIWPAITLFVSGALLAGAHYFEKVVGLTPCLLCLKQREWHWGVLAISIVALIVTRLRPGWTNWAIIVIGLALLGSTAMASYHVAVEHGWLVAQCDVGGTIDPSQLSLNNLGDNLRPPRCDEVAWSMFGISMAGYNAIISLMMALASFCVALTGRREQ